MTIDDLADLLKSRECEAVWYFHTDHFEPWSYDIDDNSARAVERFAEMARSSRYARKLSLFYSVFIPYRLHTGGPDDKEPSHTPGDSVLFAARSPRQEALAREVIRPLVDADEHEIHLHVHHEYWTRNTSGLDNPVSRWVNQSSTPDLDRARLDLYFRLCNEVIGRELGRPFDRWAFVHGNWALNASDPLICHVEDEIAMMMRHGGWGDFSFPAGRGYCDPKLEAPFTCLPLALPRVYDDPAADPRPIGLGTGLLSGDRFFIWNSPIKADFSSIDYYSPANCQLFKTPERMVQEWLAKSVILERRLFLKTHAHSMKWEYKIAEPGAVIPHCYPDVMQIFDHLARVCDRAGVELRPITVNEVMAALQEVDSRSPHLSAGSGREAAAGAAIATVIDRAPISEIATVAGDARGDDAPGQREVEELAAIVELGSGSPHYVLNPPFVADGGEAWTAALPAELHSRTDSDDRPSRSSLILLEDRMPLGPAHALHQRIRSEGRGLYSFWKTGLWFSTSDGSNPNSNGRIYAATSGPDAAPLRLPDRPVTAEGAADRSESLGSTLAAEEPKVADVEVDFVSLNDAAVSWLASWADAHPKHSRALGEYYQDRISRCTLLSNYDVAVAEYCRQLFSRTVTFFELGCGFGELCLMLAVVGFRVVGFEVDEGRCEGAAVLASKAAEMLSRPIDLTFANGIFPEAFKHEMLGHEEAVIVCTGVTSTYMIEHSEELIESLRQFNHVIVDVTRFGLVRDGEAQSELIRRIMGLGYTDVATVFRVGGPDIRHFSRQRIGRAAGEAAVLYSDVGQPVPAELQRDPLHIFFGTTVPLARLFPHLLTRATAWEPAQEIAVFPFAIPATCNLPAASHLPIIEVGTLDDSRVHFPEFGGYYLNCQFGTVKCLMLDPTANRDALVVEVSRFLAGNIVHSSVDKATNWPWRNRTRYVRPDLLLRKMFISDQPLGLECDGATDFATYIFTRLRYDARRVWVYNPDTGTGHVVLEVYFPVREKWAMVDFDFGVIVTDPAGVMLSTREIIAARASLTAAAVKPIVEKHWLAKRNDPGELYVGQMSWIPGSPHNGLTAEADFYLQMIKEVFRTAEEYSYYFRDGFDDNVHDIA